MAEGWREVINTPPHPHPPPPAVVTPEDTCSLFTFQSSPPLITDAGCLADAQRNSFISPVHLITYLRENQAGFQGCGRLGLRRGDINYEQT